MKPIYFKLCLVFCTALFLSSCGKKDPGEDVTFSNAENEIEEVAPYVDELANEKINISKTVPLNQEFEIKYKTYNPDGVGTAIFKAKSMKAVSEVAGRAPGENKKLVLVEISVRGSKDNKGEPSGFNQIGDRPSPQFVMIDTEKNKSEVEATYYSDAYTTEKKMFELSKITLDHDQWVHTALVFEIGKDITPNLAFRFTDPEGKLTFYDLQ